MFGLKNLKHRGIANKIGVLIHSQLKQALEEKGHIINAPEEVAFVSGYLRSFSWETFERVGCSDIGVQKELIEFICDGVMPGRLWDVFQKGVALNQLSQGGDKEEFIRTREAYELGTEAGLDDSVQYNIHKVTPINLSNYLRGIPVKLSYKKPAG